MAVCACFASGIPGPPGPQGPQGVQGIQGEIGPQGPQGDPCVACTVTITGVDTPCSDVTIGGANPDFTVQVDPIVNPDPCNLLACGGTGLEVFLTTLGSDCIAVTGCGSAGDPLTIDPIISTDPGNVLECRATGLFSPAAPTADITITGSDTFSIDTTVVEAPVNVFTISADAILDPDPSNQLSVSAAGLFVPDCQTPVGSIVLWNQAAPPAGWQFCDGTNGTPDLRDRVPLGAGGAFALGATGGVATTTLAVANLPSHSHGHAHGITVDFNGFNTGTESNLHDHNTTFSGDHNHCPNGAGCGDWAARIGAAVNGLFPGGPERTTFTSMANAGGHTHGIFGNNQLHVHFAGHGHTGSSSFDATATGSGAAFDNRPPFVALNFIMKMTAC